jgi:hypothetical protein
LFVQLNPGTRSKREVHRLAAGLLHHQRPGLGVHRLDSADRYLDLRAGLLPLLGISALLTLIVTAALLTCRLVAPPSAAAGEQDERNEEKGRR